MHSCSSRAASAVWREQGSRQSMTRRPYCLCQVTEVPAFSKDANAVLEELISSFGVADALKVKSVERTTNHDVKAVEYVLKEAFAQHPELAKVSRQLSTSYETSVDGCGIFDWTARR